jgi:hypothetical protein
MMTSVTCHAFLDHRHLVALLAVEVLHFAGVLHRHDAHAVGAGIGLDDDEGLGLDAVFLVLGAHAVEQRVDVGGQAFLAGALVEIHLAADFELGIDQPGIDAQLALAKAIATSW